MSFDLRDGIVCILTPNGETAGAGFVLDTDGLIATCSHVVQSHESQKRGEPQPEKTTIVFRATGESREAQIEPDWWRSSTTGEDVAFLRVKGDFPEGVKPLPLGSSEGTSNHPFDTFGFPLSNPEQGIWGDGQILGETKIEDILVRQLRSNQVTPGFSGAPVVDRLRHRVVGMVTSIARPDEYGRQAETAFITPIETLREVCSVLKLLDVCPYRNLKAFTEADATFFRGREPVIELLVNNLRNESRFLAVFGASGSGKSSVVQAGLIPRLRKGALPGSDRWDIIVTRPTDPFFKQHLAHLDQASAPVALVIDQFEELFVPSNYNETALLEVMTRLTHLLEHSPHVTLLIVMRDDFYSQLVRQETLAMWVKSRVVNVWSTLKCEEVEAIVREPAELMGWRFEEGLVETIVNDVLTTSAKGLKKDGSSESSTILPLLEFTLTQLWERRQDGILTHEAYRRIGGVTGGLRQWANNAYYTFEERLRPLVSRIFTDLVYLGDEEQHIPDSRRRRPLSTLIHNDAERTDISQIVQQLVADRLLVTSQDQESKQETVELIHDALLWEWGLLKEWVEEDRTFLRWHQKIEAQTQEWVATNIDHSTKRDAGKLLRGSDLKVAKDWLTERKADLSLQEQDFIKASSRRRIQFVMSMIVISFVLISTMGLAILFHLQVPPSPTLVTTLQDNGEAGSLRYCIDNAPSGSTITFAKGLSGTIKLKGGLVFANGKRLTITGPGASQLTISGGNTNASIDVSTGATVTLTGLSFKNSSETVGGGAFLYNQGTLTVTHSIISGNKTTSADQATGAGIENTSTGSLTVRDTIISNNSVSGQQYGQGGGIDNGGKLTVIDSTFANNIATSSAGTAIGGAIVNTQTGTVMVTGSTFSHNSASGQQYGQGGGIDNEGTLTVTDSTFANNTAIGSSVAGFAGGINNSKTGTVMVTGSTFSNNSASGQQQSQGGGIDNEGTLTVTDSTFANNTAISSNNTAWGGGIRNYRTGTVMVTSSTFSRNSASGQQYGQGGGIFTSGKLTTVNSTFSNNIATSSSGIGAGGGIYNYQTGTVMVTGSTFSHNSTSGKQEDAGGGIYTGGKLTIINSTLSNNRASGGKSYGGGIGFTGSHGSSTLIRFSTLYANTSGTDGGGIWIDPTGSSLLTISSNIIAANSASVGPDIAGVLISGGYNLIENASGATGLNARTDKLVALADLKIAATLGNNGGPTQTVALLQGSPVIDVVPRQLCSITVTDVSGHTMIITTDQRGDPRLDGSEKACDIGAFESSYQG